MEIRDSGQCVCALGFRVVGTGTGTGTALLTVSLRVSGTELTWAMPPTIFSFTTTVSFSCSSKAAAFCAAFTRLSEARFTALPAAWVERRQHELRTQVGSQLRESLNSLTESMPWG